MSEEETLRVGSRKSQLAIIQTNEVIMKLKRLHPDKKFEIVEMSTVGDKILDKPLPKIGEKSLFTKELEDALLNNGVDFVVHSLKDLPTCLPDGLTIGGVMEREDPRDALILSSKCEGEPLKKLQKGSVIGTSSLRRTAQLARNYPDLEVKNIRGNLNTRLKKLDEDKMYTGIILAAAGVKRMKWEKRISEYLDPSEFLYAVGQGAIAIECRTGDKRILDILESLNHTATILRVVCERSFLKTLGGGCSAPIAVNSAYKDSKLSLTGAVWSLDGLKTIQKCSAVKFESKDDEPPPVKIANIQRNSHVGLTVGNVKLHHLDEAEDLGRKLALEMIKVGALEIIGEAKSMNEKSEYAEMEKKSAIENEEPIILEGINTGNGVGN